jgi:phospholipid/cholesterol/gamma-HCH transport system substrate-binding protein
MAKRASPTAVGAFIVGAMVLIIAAVLVFGSGKFLHQSHPFVCFFRGNVNGLKVGAPVKFRGVQIGEVTGIRLRLPGQPTIMSQETKEVALPVFFELDQQQVEGLGGVGKNLGSSGFLKVAIKRGLRAQLATESLLTGLLYVDLDFHPNIPATLMLPPNSGYREIPTVPTSMEQIQDAALRALARLDKIDFAGLINALTQAAQAAHAFVGSSDLKEAIVQLKDTAQQMRTTLATFNQSGQQMKPLIANLTKTSEQATLTLQQVRSTLSEVNGVFDPDSPVAYHLIETLKGVDEASRAMASLADYLQRNPAALVRGKADSSKK